MKELIFYLQRFADALKNYEDRKNVSVSYSGVIINSGSNANVSGGSGNDTINNLTSYESTEAYYSKIKEPYTKQVTYYVDKIIYTGGGGTIKSSQATLVPETFYRDTQKQTGTRVKILEKSNENTKIYGGDGNDIITNAGNKAYIEGGAGNDTILNVTQYTVEEPVYQEVSESYLCNSTIPHVVTRKCSH